MEEKEVEIPETCAIQSQEFAIRVLLITINSVGFGYATQMVITSHRL